MGYAVRVQMIFRKVNKWYKETKFWKQNYRAIKYVLRNTFFTEESKYLIIISDRPVQITKFIHKNKNITN